MKIDDVKSIFFLGIGGIGMSGLARYFAHKGIKVAGYDKTSTPLTEALASEGMSVCYDEALHHIPSDVDLVVYTPAVPDTHAQYQFFKERGYVIYKRAQILGLITQPLYTIAIAGTHGKTTTSSMTAHTLKKAGLDISAFLGGVLVEFKTNYLIGTSPYVVVEADEFDRSFHQLTPSIAVINAMDPDHLDIYGTEEAFVESFYQFILKSKKGSLILMKSGVPERFSPAMIEDIRARYDVKTFGFEDQCDWKIVAKPVNNEVVFDLVNEDFKINDIKIQLAGNHNMSNAAVAVIVGLHLGLMPDELVKAIGIFGGVKRRFDYVLKNDKVVYIDDYAHHPEEIKAIYQGVRSIYPNKKIVGIFQPHLFSRTQDFMKEFAEILGKFDKTILMEIYPAREAPIPGVTSTALGEMIHSQKVEVLSSEEIFDYVKEQDFDVILTIGAGDIDKLIPNIKKILEA
jgi:UDP-N-acetylmuramate--alanine ligase